MGDSGYCNDRAPLVQRPCSTTLRTKVPHAAAEHRDICVPLLFDAASGPSHCIALARPSMQSSFSRTSLLFPSQAINHRSPRKSSLYDPYNPLLSSSGGHETLDTTAGRPLPCKSHHSTESQPRWRHSRPTPCFLVSSCEKHASFACCSTPFLSFLDGCLYSTLCSNAHSQDQQSRTISPLSSLLFSSSPILHLHTVRYPVFCTVPFRELIARIVCRIGHLG
ncbi:hypothetical protein M430DRAFT_198463 [Amorphotheca resinae ATCC 22711]|uniref:Uncharacterized protein n=1 Tax=Amorphotheca resinae ATCC 22711 TaxID=857342 RepID=A0A2T3B9V6_AMORE|nr:hypothetical protein M430DRAFT_198463 [Amorphotheca resinae ATCC 22711]PSS25106.1 hypothetical protein M430DRAFT_198463 [Amorphotheca resinae ATCC 22711]